MINAARYYRSCKLWWPFEYLPKFAGKPINLLDQNYLVALLSENIAVVVYDIRGGGASFGRQDYPWCENERRDSIEILEWVLKQSFCNGNVGIWGVNGFTDSKTITIFFL